MPSTYLAYQLVSAHLPAPPSIPNAIPELRVPSTRPSLGRPELNGPLHPGHALSTSHNPDLNLLARVIQNGHRLEIRPFDLVAQKKRHDTPGTDTLHVLFPEPLRALNEGTVILSNHDRMVYILVVSESNVVYRLSFPLGRFKSDRGARFTFTTSGGDDWCEEYEIPEEVVAQTGGVGPIAIVDAETVVLGGMDGGIVRVLRSSNSWSAYHHRISSRFRLPSLFSSSTCEDQVLSFAQFDGDEETTFYALSRDGKLRIWNVDTGSPTKTIDIPGSTESGKQMVPYNDQVEASTSTPANFEVSRIRIIKTPSPTSSYSHLVVVYVPSPKSTSSAGSFAVYRMSRSKFGTGDLSFAGERICSTSSAGGDLRNFDILSSPDGSGWTLWACWDINGSALCESVTMDDLFQFTTHIEPSDPPYLLYDWQSASPQSSIDHMDAAYFDNLLSLDPPDPTRPLDHPDIADTFVDHLFYPGRFSTLTLTTALDEYLARQLNSQTVGQLDITYKSLSQRFAAIIGSAVSMETHPQTGAPTVEIYRRDVKLEWLGVWARVRELDKHARWPIGNAILDDQQVVICRESVLVPTVMDSAGIINRFDLDGPEDLQDLPETVLSGYPLLGPASARDQALAIGAAGESIVTVLAEQQTEDGTSNCLDAMLAQLDVTTASSAQSPIESIVEGIWDDHVDPYLTEEDRTNTRRILSDSHSVVEGLCVVIDLLTDFSSSPGTPVDTLVIGGLGNSLIASSLASIIDARLTLARNALLVAIFSIVESDATADEQSGEEVIEILSQSLALYHRYRVLSWLSEQTAEEAQQYSRPGKRKVNPNEMLVDGAGTRMGEGPGMDLDEYNISYSLLHSILAHQMPHQVDDNVISPPSNGAISFLGSLRLVSPAVRDNEPLPADVKLGFTILIDNHPTAARQFTDLYPLSSGMAYIKGRACLELLEPDEAARLLQLASAGCEDRALTTILPSVQGESQLTAYYRHVTALFEEHGLDSFIMEFGQLALDLAHGDDLKDIRTKVFLASLSLGAYEDAHVILNGTTNLELRKDFLGQLISHMCEANQVGRLNALGFVGYQQEVERLLSFKARHSDPLRHPNYYKVLYSWHISRGDYRSAGEIMYLQARRLGLNPGKSSVSLFELATMQARSYLAAINCLSLVDKRQAWIAIPLARSGPRRNVKRRRVTSYLPDHETTKNPVDLITLDDIKAEYTAVLSKLLLAEAADVFADESVSIGPHELIGLLVQNGKYDAALSSASALDIDMSETFISLASRCVQLSRLSELSGGVDANSISYLFSSPLTSRLRGPPPALALRYLQIALKRYDSEKTQWKYNEVVADTLFELNADKRNGWQMPVWLVEGEMGRNPEGWISRAIKWGWVEEAIDWSLEYLRRMPAPELLPSKRTNAAYTPFNLFDRVIAASSDNSGKEDLRLKSKARELQETVERRLVGLGRVK